MLDERATAAVKGEKSPENFCFDARNERNSISHRLPLALKMEMLNEITHCPFLHSILKHVSLLQILARRTWSVRLLHLDSCRARLRRVGHNSEHLLLLHWRLHSHRGFRFGADNEFPRLLLRSYGTRAGSDHCKYLHITLKN